MEQVQRRVRGQRGGQAALAVGPVGIQDDHLQEAVSLVILNQQHQAADCRSEASTVPRDREAAGVECIVRKKGIAPAAGVDEIGGPGSVSSRASSVSDSGTGMEFATVSPSSVNVTRRMDSIPSEMRR